MKKYKYLSSLFDFEKNGYYTAISGYSHAKFSQNTEAASHVHNQMLSIIDHFGIEYYLFAGSMVGYARDKRMPLWMDDLDVIIFEEHIAKFESQALPCLRSCGFNCGSPRQWETGGYHLLALQQGNDRNLTIPLSEGHAVSVPWAQIDIFYTTVNRDGFIRNLAGWGLYHTKDIPVEWVRPGIVVDIEGRKRRVFNRWQDDIYKEYGDVKRNIYVYSHGTPYLKLDGVDWADVSSELTQIISETSTRLPPCLSPEKHAAFESVAGRICVVEPSDSFDRIVARIMLEEAQQIQLTGGDQIFWTMDLKRLFPMVSIQVAIADLREASRAAHLRAFIDSAKFASDTVAAQHNYMIGNLNRIFLDTKRESLL